MNVALIMAPFYVGSRFLHSGKMQQSINVISYLCLFDCQYFLCEKDLLADIHKLMLFSRNSKFVYQRDGTKIYFKGFPTANHYSYY